MGARYYAHVVMGLRLDHVVRVEIARDAETRYDEHTGKPYLKEVPREYTTVFGKEVPEPAEPSPRDWLPQYLRGLSPHFEGWHVFNTGEGSRGRLDQHVAGIKLAPEGGDYGESGITAMNPAHVEAARKSVEAAMAAVGEKFLPVLYLVRSVSC